MKRGSSRSAARIALPLAGALLASSALWAPPVLAAGLPVKLRGPLSPTLATLAKPSVRVLGPAEQARILGVAAEGPGSLIRHGNRVLVYVRFHHGAEAALPSLQQAGAKVVDVSHSLQTITAQIAPADLHGVAKVGGVASVSQVRAPILRAFSSCKGGSVVSEGVNQLHAQQAREFFGVEGEGVTVGVLSDSLNQANEAVTGGPIATKEPQDILSKDLPGKRNTCPGQGTAVEDLQDYVQEPGGEDPLDEGRAMLQIAHDMAPGAELAFNSAFNGEPAFAEGIENLAKPTSEGGAGAKVIADDIAYFEEPFFQDGPVAATVDRVTNEGVTYLSAAGNDNLFDKAGNEIASWEAPEYRDSGDCPGAVRALAGFNAHHCLDFNPGAPTDRTFGIKVEPHGVLSVDLQWAEPWFGVETDLDAFLLDANGELLTASFASNEETGKPVEIVQWENTSGSEKTVQLVINRFSGSANPRIKFILTQNGGGVTGVEYPKSSDGDVVGPSVYGHAGSASAIAVGAVRYEPRVGEEEGPEPYSSRGPVTHYFGPVESNSPASAIPREVISKPDVAATDCGRTTFFAVQPDPLNEPDVWHFCGTSAAAPHAAGVAALMLENEPGASPEEIHEALVGSAQEFNGVGPCAQGGGLVEALGALGAISAGPPFPPSPTGPCESPKSPGGEVFVAPGNWGSEEPPAPPPPPVSASTPPAPTPVVPDTSFLKHPRKVVGTRSKTARVVFQFGSDQAGVTFLCKFDRESFRRCGSRLTKKFALGSHTVKVKAIDASGNVDPTPAVFHFRVKRIG